MARIQAWRVTNRKYAGSAFSGEGARLQGGRFNSVGVPAVYCSGSLSLALLEILAQVNQRHRIAEHVCIPVSFPESEIERATGLPVGWDARPFGIASQLFGDAWLRERRSLVLEIPSVIVPMEFNYVINPGHPAFHSIEIGDAIAMPIDDRLLPGDI